MKENKSVGTHIMVVDDEAIMMEITCEILNGSGYTTSGFSLPEEALAEFQKTPEKYSLIITDITMPKLRGEELARRIHLQRQDLPVIFTTGLDRELNQLSMIKGPFKTLQKPFDMAQLVQLVDRILK